MALSASDQIILQQSLSQLAQAASAVARYSTAFNNAQQANTASTGNLTRQQSSSGAEYEKLSKTLKSNSEAFKNTLKNIDDYRKKVQQSSNDYQTASDNLKAFNDSVSAAGGMMTSAQRAQLASLNSILAAAADERSKVTEAQQGVFNLIGDIVQSTKEAVRYRDEFEKDYFGRQLASEIKTSLENIAGQTAGTFSKQLLTLADVERISNFADVQSSLIQSMIGNSNILDDSNIELGRQYVKMGESLGYTSVQFDQLRTRIESYAAGSSTMFGQDFIDKIVDAQTKIAETINDSNEKLSTTIDRDLKSFGGNVKRYMYENRNGFDKLIDELRDISARNGSLFTGNGGVEAGEVVREAVGELGKVIIPKLGELGLIVLKHYTREYDSLTKDNVVTNRLMAWQLRLTEEQYRQTRGESKSFWSVTSAEGQDQLDSFMDARYAQLKSVFGSDPVALSKISGRLIGLENLSNMTSEGTTDLLKKFKTLGLTSRLTNDQLEQMFTNIALSNNNQILMASLNAKERKARMDSIKNTMAFGAGLGMSQESLEKFTKAVTESAAGMPSVSETVSILGQGLTAFNVMKSVASGAGMDLSTYGLSDAEKNKQYLELVQKKEAGVALTPEQTLFVETMDFQIAKFKAEAKAQYNELVEKYGISAGYSLQNTLHLLDKTLESSKIKGMVDPISESLTALEQFGIKGKDVPKTLEELNRAQEELAKQRKKTVTEAITGGAATASRVVDATTGEGLYSDIAKLAGGAALGSALGSAIGPTIRTVLTSVIANPLSKVTPAGWVATALAAGGLYAYNKLSGSEEEEKKPAAQPGAEASQQPGAEPSTQSQNLPSTKITAADAVESSDEFNGMFAKFMEKFENQSNDIQNFLRNISMNSTTTNKVMGDWYKLYQDVNPITSNMTTDSSTDTSKTH